MAPVTDPDILRQLNAPEEEETAAIPDTLGDSAIAPEEKSVIAPEILAELNTPAPEAPDINEMRRRMGFGPELPTEAIPSAPEERGIVSTFGAGIRRGTVGLGEQLGSAVSYIGAETGLPSVEEIGDVTSKFYEDIIKSHPEWSPAKEQASRKFYHPERLAETIGEALPLTVGAMGAGILAALAAPVGAVGSSLIAAGVAGTAFGLTTAGATLKEAEKAGVSREEGLKAARLHGGGEALLEFVPDFMFMRMLKLARKPLKKEVLEEGIKSLPRLRAFAKDAGKIALVESAEEGMQTAWGNYVAQGYFDPERAIEAGIPESMVVGAIMGLGLGGAASLVSGRGAVKTEEEIEKPPPIETQGDIDTDIAEGVNNPDVVDEAVPTPAAAEAIPTPVRSAVADFIDQPITTQTDIDQEIREGVNPVEAAQLPLGVDAQAEQETFFQDMFGKPQAEAAIPFAAPEEIIPGAERVVREGEGFTALIDEEGNQIIEHVSGARATRDAEGKISITGDPSVFGTTKTDIDIQNAREDVDLNPTQAQIEAGNAKVGHVTVQGLDIAIENPQGSERSGKEDGDTWVSTMHYDYGRIKRTEGADGEEIDVYLGPSPETSDTAYVVHQIEPETGEYDEDKVMIGFDSQVEAEEAYRGQYDQDQAVKPNRIGSITPLSMAVFKNRIKNNQTLGKEAVKLIEDKAAAPPQVEAVTEPSPKEAAPAPEPEIEEEVEPSRVPEEEIDEKKRLLQKASAIFKAAAGEEVEQSRNPERFHTVTEDENSKNLKIGDWVISHDPKWGDTLEQVISITKDFGTAYGEAGVKSVRFNSSGWSSFDEIEKTDAPEGGWIGERRRAKAEEEAKKEEKAKEMVIREGDILTKAGKPFKSEGSARTGIIANKKRGQGYVPVEVEGGWVARKAVEKPEVTAIPPTTDELPIRGEVQFANNKLFTSDKVAAARARMKSKLSTAFTGLDPEMLQDGITIAGAYIESGTRSFVEYSKAMVNDFGEAIKPYLRSFYEGVRHFPGLETEGMTSPADIDAVEIVTEEVTEPIKPKEEGVKDEPTRDGIPSEGALEAVPPGEGEGDGGKRRPDTGVRGGGAVDLEGDGGTPGVGGVGGIGVGGIEGDIYTDRAGIQSLEEPETDPRSLKKKGVNPGNYQIKRSDAIGTGTRGEKIDNNLEAIRLTKELDKENRYPTVEEQSTLVKYVGWGGLKNVFDPSSKKPQDQNALKELQSLLTKEELFEARQSVQSAHYTSRTVIGSMYDIVQHLGIKGGHILEPTYGTGLFTGLMPADMSDSSKWYGSEMDVITARIGQYLYPRAQFLNSPFEDAQFPYNKFDMAIGNPPFGDWRITDTNKRRSVINGMKVHNYIIGKSGMHVKPGGIMSFVVTSRFMDTADPEIRNYLAKEFNFLGAVRLPNTAFKEGAGTDVTTDIVFFQKLTPGESPSQDTTWLNTKGTMTNEREEEVKLNQYFVDNPTHMMGIPSMQGTMFGGRTGEQFTLEPKEGLDVGDGIKALLDKELAFLKDIASQNEKDIADALAMSVELNREGVGIGGYFVENKAIHMRMDDDIDGNPVYEQITPATQWTAKQKLGLTRFNRIKGILGIRAKAYELISSERFNLPAMEGLRKDLNKLYDNFVSKFGFINDSANVSLMSEDIKIEAGLESGYRKPISRARAKTLGVAPSKARAEKASILNERIYFPQKEILHADSVADGYDISLSEKGKLDIPYIAGLTNKTDEEVAQELSDKGLAFQDPDSGEWIQEDAYLSGNVKEKYRKVEDDLKYKKNADALEKVLPEDLRPDDIFVDMGATWVPKEVYASFLEALGVSEASVLVTPQTGRVSISSAGDVTDNDLSVLLKNQDYSTVDLFNSVANNKALVAHDGHGDERTINRERTNALKSIAKKMKDIFKDWVFADSAQAEKLAEIYNETQNTHAPRKIDGSHLNTVGANPAVQLYDTQRNGAWRMIQQPAVLLDHIVGAGKTMTIITGVQERKRLGLSKKPLIVVPNHILSDWSRTYAELYPGANILAATEKDFASKNRKRLLARMATGNYDAILIGHSSLSFIPLEAETTSDLIQEEVKFLVEALSEADTAGDKRTVRTLTNRIERKRQRIKRLMDTPKSEVATFEAMGIDYFVLDESHEFKNLEYSTYMQSMAGMGNPQGSMKAFDLYAKLRYLTGKGGGTTFATGTPISNSLVEMYSLLRYLNNTELQKRGIGAFDSWAKSYAGIENRIEYTSTQKLKERTIMASFNNLPELKQLYMEFADVVDRQDLKDIYAKQMELWNKNNPDDQRSTKFPEPTVEGGGRQIDIADSSPAQKEYMDYLVARAEALEINKDPEYRKIDNALWVMNDARKAALDIRLADPSADPGPDSKIDRTARSVKGFYDKWNKDKGTQLVFSDLSTPLKQAEKGADRFIKKALRKGGLSRDSRIKSRLEGMDARDKWPYISHEIAMKIERLSRSGFEADMKERERLEDFMGSVSDEDVADLTTMETKFSVYDELKKTLIDMGIPENEIAFIHDANNITKKTELFELVNSGRIRVLIGSTRKMGAGTNVQERLVALHHMDAPWRPSDVEQREGRIIRQGNMLYAKDPDNFQVAIKTYSTRNTNDTVMWQILARKAEMIESLKSDKRSVEEDTSDSASYANMMAEASGNPAFKEKFKLEGEIADLEGTERRIKANLSAATRTANNADRDITVAKNKLNDREEGARKLSEAETFIYESKSIPDDLKEGHEKARAEWEEDTKAWEEAIKPWDEWADAEPKFAEHGNFKDYTDALEKFRADQPEPKKPASPVGPDAPSRLRKHSKVGELIHDITETLSETPLNTVITVDFGGIELSIEKAESPWAKAKGDFEYEATFDGYRFDRSSSQKPTFMVTKLFDKARLEEFAEEGVASAERAIENTGKYIKEAALTLDKVQFKEADALAEKRERYEKVREEVAFLEEKMAAERVGKVNKYINADKTRDLKKTEPAEESPAFYRGKDHLGEDFAEALPKMKGETHTDDIRAIVDIITTKWKNAPKVRVISRADKLPDHLKEYADSSAGTGAIEGIFDPKDNTVYLIAENISNASRAAEVLFHEALGHFGLRGMLGQDIRPLLNQVYIKYRREAQKIAQQYGIDLSKEKGRLEAAEEVLAGIAQKKSDQGITDRAVAVIRTWLRKAGFNIVLSDNDILNIVSEAGRFVREGKKPLSMSAAYEGPPLFSRAEKPKVPSEYEQNKDSWFGNKDWAVQRNSVEAANIQDVIKAYVGEKKYGPQSKLIDQALHLHVDMKRNPTHVDEFWDKFTDEQKRVIRKAREIEDIPELKAISDQIQRSYESTGIDAMSAGVIRNVIDNYVARTWKRAGDKPVAETMRKFGTTTRHSKARIFETILEGWSKGYELAVTGASNNLNNLKDEIARTIEDKRLIKEGRRLKDEEGRKLFSTRELDGYKKIEHPNFVAWEHSGKVGELTKEQLEELEIDDSFALEFKPYFSKDLIVDAEGNVLKRKSLYAPEAIAKNLNNILVGSKLKGAHPAIDVLTKYNAIIKAWILQTSFFHHLAFIRSYIMGTTGKTFKEWNVRKAYKQGLEDIKNLTPEIEILVRNGLTLGNIQDWEESILRSESTIFGQTLDKIGGVPKQVKDKINELRERQADFLFKQFGAGLKARAALIEYRNALKKHPEMEPNDRAKMVANLINDDFGGLHLGRMGRNQTVQHIFRLFALAPDWTESNIRAMVKAFKAGGPEERALYRRFWASVATKGIVATALASILLSLGDDEDAIERFKIAWAEGHMRWLDIDITPIYKVLGGETEARKYFSIFGHFKDPIKFITHPIRSAHHKGSVLYGIFHEAMAGTDWKGARFTSIDELMGLDDKGVYRSTTKHHRAGDPKGGKLIGQTVKQGFGIGSGPIGIEEMPSYLLSQVEGAQPVQVQNFLAWMQGEIDGFDALGRSLGFNTASSYPTPKKLLSKWADDFIKAIDAKDRIKQIQISNEVKAYNIRSRSRGEDPIILMKEVARRRRDEVLAKLSERRRS